MLPWVVLRDFTDLLFQYEKRGRHRHPEPLLRGFGEALEDCGLMQIPLIGYQFTWEKWKGTKDWVEEKLDRVVANEDWRAVVEGARVYNIQTRRSDHSALFLDVRPGMGTRVGHRSFRFEMAWLLDGGCREVVKDAWGRGVEELQARLQRCGMKLQRCGGDRFHMFGERIAGLKKQQMNCRGRMDLQALAEFRRLETELVRLEKKDDVFWKQRAKWVDGDAMKPDVMSYFNDIFTANPAVSDVADFFTSIPTRVTQSHNEWLDRPYDPREVRDAFFAMFSDKAPGPDGMNLGFYQQFWDIVGADVTDFVLECLNSGSLPAGLNESNVVLIPKKQSPEMVTDLRPIALSTVVYKIIAKVIANRLKPLLGDIIYVSQSAFILGRLITDNILVAAEVGHFLNRKQLGRVGRGALKLDMVKAYDRREWTFLRKMLIALGFQDRNTQLMERNSVAVVFGVQQAAKDWKLEKETTVTCWEGNFAEIYGTGHAYIYYEVFLLPNSLCTSLERIMNRFWWRNGKDGGGIHWLAWDKLCKPKKFGGLGFKDLRAFNVAILGKQGWRFLTNPQSLVARVYKARYYPNSDFLGATVGNNPSFLLEEYYGRSGPDLSQYKALNWERCFYFSVG
ncbi:PREDICTED: uncharacterized protein LOC109189548 [Ipomoea nil]|uniref:uncharacterized protein LOC109189548 n=1 Tax=Ipomoea nil TaxID=35883 RepID=UPI000900BC19|nr:PREDICTED: uncharacterized protein LOC109189548 [Ipomoea nil]